MNKKEFEDAVSKIKTTYPININFLSDWFEATILQMGSLASQGEAIKHLRYRGDNRERDFNKLLAKSLPPAVILNNGFVSNEYATISNEQDCLLLDARHASPFVKTDSAVYYPYESVLGSVEIKSKLTLSELRKIAINCASLKRLKKKLASEKEKEHGKVAYFVFAYSSTWSIEETARKFNGVLSSIPYDLRPSMVYVLNKGFLLPSLNGGFGLGPQELFVQAEFAAQGAMKVAKSTEPTQALPFLWFLSNIIDHCTSELFSRKNFWLGEYVFAPLVFQQYVEKQIENKA